MCVLGRFAPLRRPKKTVFARVDYNETTVWFGLVVSRPDPKWDFSLVDFPSVFIEISEKSRFGTGIFLDQKWSDFFHPKIVFIWSLRSIVSHRFTSNALGTSPEPPTGHPHLENHGFRSKSNENNQKSSKTMIFQMWVTSWWLRGGP
jgi:hypothetical protein